MITELKKPNTKKEVDKILNPIVKKWFYSRFKEYSIPQKHGVLTIHNRENILVSAPTGATKTLTAFLSILNELVDAAEKGILEDKVYAIYISPLKALNNDIHRNLMEPLKEIEEIAGKELGIRVGVRTGDTTSYEKSKMLKKPPHILITTPESLAIVLSSIKFRDHMKEMQWCIIDEIHSLAENKRGVHMSLSIERLARLSTHMTRIGLSATVAPIEEVAKFLVGYEKGKERDCKIVNVQFIKETDLKVISPLSNLIDTTPMKTHHALYDLLDSLIQKHKSTLIFTNTRAATERVVDHLKNKFPKKYIENIEAHHGSLSKEHRLSVEKRLKEGNLKTVVCLDGNTSILSEDGKWKKIKDLNEGDFVQCMDGNLKLSNNKILTTFKVQNNSRLLSIRSQSGEEVLCTPDHKFLTINKIGNIEWVEASKLKDGQFIASLRKANYKELKGDELDKFTFDNYPEEYFVSLKSSFIEEIRTKIIKSHGELKKFWQKNIKAECSYSFFLHLLRGEYALKIGLLRKITQLTDLDDLYVFENITHISSSKIKTPKIKITPSLMRFLGFMYAEGYINKRDVHVSNKDKTVLRYYRELILSLRGKNAFEHKSSSGTPVLTWTSGFLVEFLKNLGFNIGRKSRISNIPPFIFRLSKEYLSEFISGYMDGDGYLEKKDGRVFSAGICTCSKEIAEDFHRILLREDIISSIRVSYYDTVQEFRGRDIIKKGNFYTVSILGGKNLRNFSKFISPARRNLKLISSCNSLNGYCNKDIIPNMGKRIRDIRHKSYLSTNTLQKELFNPMKYELGTRNISRNQFKRYISHLQSDISNHHLADSDIFWTQIKEIKKDIRPKYVYNIEVEKNHNYIANSFITKNCSTSLELGIDIGYIDLVIMLSSPKSVARALQRSGRAGHALHATTKARLIVLDRDDLVECSVLLKSAIEKKIDRLHIPSNCLDVLAQQIIGIAIEDKIKISDLFKLIKQSYCYNDLDRKDFMQIIDYLSGKFVSLEDRHVYAKIWYDEETGMVGRKGKMTRIIYMTNIGTIPDESYITVKIGNETIGKLDEGFLEKLKPGDVFVLGGNTYTFKFSRGMVAQVSASANRPPTVPRWTSESLPLSFDLANDIGKFRKLMNEKFCIGKSKKHILKFIHDYLYVDQKAANAIYEYFYEQYQYAQIPSNSRIIIEHTKNHFGNIVVFHSLFGRRVNDCLSRAVAFAISKTEHKDVEIGINDNGFYVSYDKKVDVMKSFKRIKSKELRQVMEFAIDKTEVMKRRFRHCATRALMILRNYKGRRKRVGRQQVGSMILMAALKQIDKDFVILKESRREVLEDLMDIESTKKIVEGIEKNKIKVEEIFNDIPSPFAFNLVMQGYTDILKMEDKIEFLKRMHNNVLAKISLNKDVDKEIVGKASKFDESDYQEIFEDMEEKVQEEKDQEDEELKSMAWNLKKVPMYVKEEIVKLIDGDKDIRDDVIVALREHSPEIKKSWPKKLRRFVFNRLKIR